MIRRPPRSPLFPSTPLSRSQADEGRRAEEHEVDTHEEARHRLDRHRPQPPLPECAEHHAEGQARAGPEEDERRSEEHTSELQSRLHLVCRLLLEKKKTYHTS